MATPLILDYLPRKQFERFHERRERFACIVTHRRAGKTVACVQELQRAAMQSRNLRPRFAYLAPFQKQAKAVAWDYLRAAMASVRPRATSALGIDRADMAARARQTGRNFVFFDAPVGLIFTIHSALTKHSWLDYGLFLQTLMLAAQVRGLATCPQVSFVRFQSIIAEQLGLGAEEVVTCGMSCGYLDEQAAVNRLNMPREPLDGFTRWLGFDE